MLGYKILIYYVSRIEQHQNDLLEIPIKLITRFKINQLNLLQGLKLKKSEKK
jgi:hypothetical protein